MRVEYDVMKSEFERVLEKHGLGGEDGKFTARLFASSSLDGVYSHGLNRFPSFIRSIESGIVDVDKRAQRTLSFGALERWDGQKGPGMLNAAIATERAVELSRQYTVGVVGLANTNHWMRAGSYGIMAAERDCIGIMWTNTMQNMPAWGGMERKIGNNPAVFAVPHNGSVVLLDCAMSMFSYGKLDNLRRAGKETPVDAGYDTEGRVTRNPADVIESMLVMPMGFWKGSGLSILLDLIASAVSGGLSTSDVGKGPETGVSQFFCAINLAAFPDRKEVDERIEHTLSDIRSSVPRDPAHTVHTPGEGMEKTRADNLENGIPVDEAVWAEVKAM